MRLVLLQILGIKDSARWIQDDPSRGYPTSWGTLMLNWPHAHIWYFWYLYVFISILTIKNHQSIPYTPVAVAHTGHVTPYGNPTLRTLVHVWHPNIKLSICSTSGTRCTLPALCFDNACNAFFFCPPFAWKWLWTQTSDHWPKGRGWFNMSFLAYMWDT